jgi:hypothetical protein
MFVSGQAFEHAQRVAKAFAGSDIVPQRYQGNIANCIVALELAARLEVSPLMVMQNLVIINGEPTWKAQFVIAIINSSPKFIPGSLDYQWEFPDNKQTSKRCRAFATARSTDKPIYGTWVSMDMARGEGWLDRKGSKWQTMPDHMLCFRAATFFGREHCAERLLGMQSADEAEDIIDITPTRSGVAGAKEMLTGEGQ